MKIEIEGDFKQNGSQLINMLAWIELLGIVGHSADFKVDVDGDGNSRWKFKFDDIRLQEQYEQLRKHLKSEFINSHKDIKYFRL